MRAGVVTAVVATLLMPQVAAFDDPVSVILSGSASGAGWVFAKVSATGDRFEAASWAGGSRNFQRAEVRLYDSSLNFIGYFHNGAWQPRIGARINATYDESRQPISASAWAPMPPSTDTGAQLTIESLGGTYYVLLSAVGDNIRRAWEIRGGPGTEVVAATYGTRSFAWRTDEYPAHTSIHAELLGIGAHVVDGGAARIGVGDTLIATFEPVNPMPPVKMPSIRSMSVELPDGSTVMCPCILDDPAQAPLGQGAYTFRLDEVGTHAPLAGGHVFLIAHDVQVPT